MGPGTIDATAARFDQRRPDRINAAAAILAALDPRDMRTALETSERMRALSRAELDVLAGKATTAQRLYGGEAECNQRATDSPTNAKEWTQAAGEAGDPFGVTLDNLEHAMRYQSWNPMQVEQGDRVREVLTSAARVFLRELPNTPLRRQLLEEVLQLRMLANMAISFPYGFGR